MDINKNRKYDLISIFLLGIIIILFFFPVIFQGRVFYFGDIHYSFYPHQRIVFNSYRQGRLPLWNPYLFCGMPLLANIAHSALYPLKLLFLFFPFTYAFNLFIIFHFFLAGAFTYILMRIMKRGHAASFISGVIFMLNCPIILEYTNMFLITIVWIPLIFGLFYLTLEKLSPKWAILTGVALSMQFLSGSPQHVYFSILLMLTYLLFLYPSKKALGKRGIFYPLILFFLIGIVSLSISMIQLAPAIEFILHSTRGKAMTYQESVIWSLHPLRLIQLLMPHFFGETSRMTSFWGGFLCNSPYKNISPSYLKSLYVGLFTIPMFFFSLKYIREKTIRYFYFIFIFFLLVSFGKYTPIYFVLYKILPLFNIFRWPVKYFLICVFSLSILAGAGFDHLLERPINDYGKGDRVLKVLGLTFSLILTLGGIFFGLYRFKASALTKIFNILVEKGVIPIPSSIILSVIGRELIHFFALGILLFLIITLWRNKHIQTNTFKILIVCFVVIDIFLASMKLDFFTTQRLYDYTSPLKERVSMQGNGKEGPFRIFNSQYERPQHWRPKIHDREMLTNPELDAFWCTAQVGPNTGLTDCYYVNGGTALFLSDYLEVEKIMQKKPIEMFRALNVKYLILEAKKEHGFETDKVWPFYNLILAKIHDYKPRIFMVTSAIFKETPEDILDCISQASTDITSQVVLAKDGQEKEMVEDDLPLSYEYEIVKFIPEDIMIKIKSNKPGYLVFTDFYFNGWHAYIDNKPTKLLRADHFFKGVEIDEGEHLVRFKYNSRYLGIGALITCLSLLAIIIFFVKTGCRPWKK